MIKHVQGSRLPQGGCRHLKIISDHATLPCRSVMNQLTAPMPAYGLALECTSNPVCTARLMTSECTRDGVLNGRDEHAHPVNLN